MKYKSDSKSKDDDRDNSAEELFWNPFGLMFVVFGLNGFLHFIPAPQYPGVAGQFIGAMFNSHFYILVFLTQLVGGLLLLADRYVPLALLLLGPVIVNILNFHLSMLPSTIPLALVATALWLILFVRMRSAFAGVFVPRISSQPVGSRGEMPRPQEDERGNRAA